MKGELLRYKVSTGEGFSGKSDPVIQFGQSVWSVKFQRVGNFSERELTKIHQFIFAEL
jgi:hypothetical protein